MKGSIGCVRKQERVIAKVQKQSAACCQDYGNNASGAKTEAEEKVR